MSSESSSSSRDELKSRRPGKSADPGAATGARPVRHDEDAVDRRTFLGVAAALPVSSLAARVLGTGGAGPRVAPGAWPGGGLLGPAADAYARRVSDASSAASLTSIAESILPAALGPSDYSDAAIGFEQWLNEYQPGAEQNHGYGSGDVRYGDPEDPRPAWREQLLGLDEAAQERHGQTFDALGRTERQDLVASALDAAGAQRLGSPSSAPHVALALLSWWYAGPRAHDLAYGVRIGKETCRPLAGVEQRPVAIDGTGRQSG